MTLFTWGANSYGQLGLGYVSEQQNSPIVVDTKVEFSKIVGGGGHTLAITADDNRLYGCGWNHSGQLTDFGGVGDLLTFTDLGLAGVTDIAGGWDFSLVLTEEGSVYGCGSNKFGQLGKFYTHKDDVNSSTCYM
jgi:alpha-tubulin suppressor-like RCC1 family protein